MRIHTVKEGDTIFKIARLYSTPPAKIIENNSLLCPDRLYPGQKLGIFTPTRSYTVKGGDTLDSIASRFRTEKTSLLKNNPGLMGNDRIYPGQIIAVKYESGKYGNAVVNGYYYANCPKERLSLFLPYLTYLTVSSVRWRKGKLESIFNSKDAVEKSHTKGVIPILRVYTETCIEELLGEKECFFENVISYAKNNGFSGISLAAYNASKDLERYPEFFLELKHKLMSEDLELHTELDGNQDITAFENLSCIADVSVLNYEKGALLPLPDFKEGEEALFKSYAENCEGGKTLIDLSGFAYINGNPLEFSEAEKFIISRGITPEYCEKSKTCSFTSKRFSLGKKEEINVIFTTPENTEAKLELVGALGYMGVSFDIMRSEVRDLMMFNSLFHSEKKAESSNNSCRGQD